MLKLFVALLVSGSVLASCGMPTKESPIEEVNAATYVSPGQTKLTLITMINNRSGEGAHSALLIEGSQTVIFDPAGSFVHESVPERGDVIYGMSPGWVQSYKSAHARSAFHVVSQEISVTPAQAERALQLAQSNGSVPGAFCTNATSGILRKIQGFQTIKQVYFPLNLMEQFAKLPGVKTTRLYEDDEGNVRDGIKPLTQ